MGRASQRLLAAVDFLAVVVDFLAAVEGLAAVEDVFVVEADFVVNEAFFAVDDFAVEAFFVGAFAGNYIVVPATTSLARLSAISCTARSNVISSTCSPRGIVAFVSPSSRPADLPSRTFSGFSLTGSLSNSFSAAAARLAPYFGCL